MDRQYKFDAVDVALALVAALVEVLPRLGADLRDQVERAANSVVLNFGEGNWRMGKDRAYHFRVAGGSANEVDVALRAAVAWRRVSAEEVAQARGLCDRARALSWRLSR